jgi:hypothetical protein
MVGDAFLSAKASGDVGGQVRLFEMLGNGFKPDRGGSRPMLEFFFLFYPLITAPLPGRRFERSS